MKVIMMSQAEELAETKTSPVVVKKCSHCHNVPPIPGKGRCAECLQYAADWQAAKTNLRKQRLECVTCGTFTGGPTRCSKCSDRKSDKYYAKKGLVLVSA